MAELSERPSQLTHIKDPKLVRNFQKKAHELEQLIIENEDGDRGHSAHGYNTHAIEPSYVD